jgi:2-haloacid dehalogenase
MPPATSHRYPLPPLVKHGILGGMPPTHAGDGPIDAVVFDLGGVVIDWDPRHLYRQLFDDEDEMEQFLATICTLEWHEEHDRGRSTAESCAELAASHPEWADLITAWAERGEEMVGGTIDGSIELVAELKARGVPCYVLSNMEPETFPLRLARYPFLQSFDGHVISGFEGVVKPDPAIFRTLLQRFDLRPDRTLFVDDRDVNVKAAQDIGIRAVRFESPPQLRECLEELGLL